MQKSKSDIHELLKSHFGYDGFRLNQQAIIESIMSGQDTLAIMPTGGGKSICYQLPALALDGVTVVISPLISLMQDQVTGLSENGIEAVYLNSSLNFDERKQAQEKLESGQAKIVYMAPEGVLNPNQVSFLRELDVALFAVDEAHCVSQWGHEFRQDYRRLFELREVFPKVPFLALTATADEKTRDDICAQLRLNKPNIFISSFDRANIRYSIQERESEIVQLEQFIRANHQDQCGIVYCLSRKKVEKVATELQRLGFNAVPYHAGLPKRTRERNQRRFDVEENLIVVATIAFGMGIDRPDVRFVAHLDLPKSIEGYYQETGRAGRDGEASQAWMIYGLADVVKLSQMLEQTDADPKYKKHAREKLNQMLGLCESLTCRRHYLLDYFGEDSPKECGNCDACLEPQDQWDATKEGQMLFSAIYRTGQSFGAGHVIDVLRGSKSAKIKERRHDQLSVYGIGQSLSKTDWNRIIRQCLTLGYIRITDWDYRSLGLTELCRPILRGEDTLMLKKMKSSMKAINRKKAPSTVHLDHGEDDLFARLRALRLELAKEKGIPPYMIFSDKSLHDMCAIKPENSDQMLMVHGVGQSKLDAYGSKFLDEIKQGASS